MESRARHRCEGCGRTFKDSRWLARHQQHWQGECQRTAADNDARDTDEDDFEADMKDLHATNIINMLYSRHVSEGVLGDVKHYASEIIAGAQIKIQTILNDLDRRGLSRCVNDKVANVFNVVNKYLEQSVHADKKLVADRIPALEPV